MTSRYINTPFFVNNYAIYENELEERGLKAINQYTTVEFAQLKENQKGSLVEQKIFWEYGDRLDKLSSRAYKDPQYWWIIARYNNKPTDAHFERGDEVLIPQPLSLILAYYTE